MLNPDAETCENCKWRKGQFCHCNPPVVISGMNGHPITIFPEVSKFDFCKHFEDDITYPSPM